MQPRDFMQGSSTSSQNLDLPKPPPQLTIMDLNYTDDENDAEAQAQAMAVAMGFSGFGSQKPPAKKRKFNAATDAYIEGQDLAKLDKGGKKGQGSGGNTMPLGKARVFGVSGAKPATDFPASRNGEEIDLGDEDEGPNYIDTSKTPPAEVVEDPGVVGMDQASAVSEAEAKEMQARIDAILTSIEDGNQGSSIPPDTSTEAPQKIHGLPQRPQFGDTAYTQGEARSGSGSRKDHNDSASVTSSSRPIHKGERNPTWYVRYYDPNFNENPWERLEKERGLQPLCKWPEDVRRRKAV